ncbi:hypothetical protein [Pseudomonas sp. NPDC088444]|uniref:hypothetical protein n=1 Tax=Pseudomonas sp. NPDC088444 TaxID=3364456 RepID=UPI00384AEDEA
MSEFDRDSAETFPALDLSLMDLPTADKLGLADITGRIKPYTSLLETFVIG